MARTPDQDRAARLAPEAASGLTPEQFRRKRLGIPEPAASVSVAGAASPPTFVIPAAPLAPPPAAVARPAPAPAKKPAKK